MDLAWAEPSFSMYEMEDAIEDLQVRLVSCVAWCVSHARVWQDEIAFLRNQADLGAADTPRSARVTKKGSFLARRVSHFFWRQIRCHRCEVFGPPTRIL